jgi:hypothetical protein
LTLPSSVRQLHSSQKKPSKEDKKKSGSRKSGKKSKHVSISEGTAPPEQEGETTELMPATSTPTTSALIMKEASANGEYFVLDKNFC